MTTNNGSLKEVQGRYDGPALEQEILDFWAANSIFDKSLELTRGRPRFSFNEGPPTANGRPGIHHVLARTFKDIYPRYKTMRGYYAPRKGGWDTHGLPVEHEIEKQLGIFDKNEIEEKVGISEFTRLCRESVMTYIGDWEKMTRRMGYWVNLDEAYYTLDNRYIESVWNLLRRIWDKGLIYQGYKVVPYDPRIGATLSSHEVSLGYREVEDPSITVRFRVADSPGLSFLVWTTTPWTLPSNLLLAVGSDIEYSFVQTGDETVILASARIDAYFKDRPHTVVRTATGSELVGMRYERLFDFLEVGSGDPFRVLDGDFVSTLDGTGIVHVAPAYGVDDLELGQRERLPVVHGVGLDGHFKAEAGPVAGKFFKDADPTICDLLEQRGLMFLNEKALHNYPFGWRTGDPLIYYAKEAWFIRTTEIKDRLVSLNQTIHWVPETIRDGRFGNWLENNIDWALSRERFWGTPLPLWTDGEGDFVCIGSLAELEKLSGRSVEDLDLHRPQIDEITFFKDGRRYRRVPEVIDCWFDSGAMTYAQWHYPFENRDKFDAHFPADYICEAIDQTRGWFYTLHAIAALVDDSVAYRNCVCLSHIVDKNGKKMSKSLGNIVNPYDVFDTVGVDALRWLFLSRTPPDAQKRISVDIVREVAATFVNTLWNAYAFFVLYARLDGADLSRRIPAGQRPEIDQWILALAHRTVKTATRSLDRYDAYSAGQAIEKLVDQLSNWYIRRNRRRFWKSESGDDKQAAYLTLFECLDIIQRLIAPFMPFLAENMYRNLSACLERPAESVHLAEWPGHDEALLNDDLVFEMDTVQAVVGLGRTAREASRIRIRQPLRRLLVHCPEDRARQAITKHRSQLQEELNIREIDFIDSGTELIRYDVTPNFRTLGKRYGSLMPAIKDALSQADARAIADAIGSDGQYGMEIDGQAVRFEAEDLQIHSRSAQGFACAEAEGYLVALDTEVDHELRVEGIARELVRTIQEARKSAGLQISDRILLSVSGSGLIDEAMAAHREHIMSETLATGACGDTGADFTMDRSLDECQWTIRLKKA
ncbi:MAG: isoleucine--tRNA ligase [Gammaproteobacteria bacterium]|nr:isoleucine--tRNA ligase [Gammaproteobacteria bacterium]MYD76475.1 isoleucine--tRNA ligase [Gammaproteobacteria bacterium]MYJ52858.1 isoleucine--tRNA ligase [Gammaproteobacteria bacterium]